MSKTAFSKFQLIILRDILLKHKMLPSEKIAIYTDPLNSDIGHIYSIIRFVKGKKQIDIGFVTKTYPRTQKLEDQ